MYLLLKKTHRHQRFIHKDRMPRYTPYQEKKFEKVLREYKHHTLHAGSKRGPLVKSRGQALAIAFSEANSVKRRSALHARHNRR